jgi:predicted nucleic acid-binding protein
VSLVLDASALAEVLLGSDLGERFKTVLRQHRGVLHIPDTAVVETVSVFRGLLRGGVVTADRAAEALADLRVFPARRWLTDPLTPRIWALRDNVTAYDACYVALAERLQASVLTGDRHLRRGAEKLTTCVIIGPDEVGSP